MHIGSVLSYRFLQNAKTLCCILLCLTSLNLEAQEELLVQNESKDSIIDEYIIDQKKRFNVKLEVSNDISVFNIVNDDLELNLKPNLNLRYALVFSYKFLSVRIGIRPKTSEEEQENKGGSDTFRLRLQLLFDNWNHVLEYHIDKGYYVTNSNSITSIDSDIRIQFPEMSSNVLFGSSSYKLNKNYSMRAFQSQTEIQVKSAGSFMPGISYNFYSLKGLDVVKDTNGDRINREFYNEYEGANLALLVGYYYTFVFKKNWFANAYGVPSAGIDVYNVYSTTPYGSDKRTLSDFYAALHYGFGGGYNGDKFFFGTELKYRITSEKFNSNKVRISPSQDQFNVYFGYRFKAPKTISRPVDLIEEKVPILKDDSDKN